MPDSQSPDNTQLRLKPPSGWPARMDDDAMYGLAGDIVRAFEPETEADPAALLVHLLVMYGNALGPKPHFMVGRTRHAFNLFALFVGPTAKGRKGTAFNDMVSLFRVADPYWVDQCIKQGLSSGEGLIWHVRDRRNGHDSPYECSNDESDKGVQEKRLMVVEGEFSGPLRAAGRQGSTLSSILRAGWDSGKLGTLVKGMPASVEQAHISVIGHITESDLRQELRASEIANGFGNRFQHIAVIRSRLLPHGGQVDGERLQALASRLATALKHGQGVDEVKRTNQANTLWEEIYEALSVEAPGLLGSILSRAEAQVLRLSCIYALLDGGSLVEPVHLRAALSVWRYSEASAEHVYGNASGDPVADEIGAALHQAGSEGMTRTEVSARFGRHETSSRIGAALAALKLKGLVRLEREQTGGRPTERWFITSSTSGSEGRERSEEGEGSPRRAGGSGE